jgi:mutator protein MutT
MQNYVLLMLLNDRNELLMFKRINATFGNNEYSLIGGKIEPDETVRQAIVRETQEEIGITIRESDLVLEHTLYRKGTDTNFFALIFSAPRWQGTPTNKEPHKHTDLRWFPLNALPENMLSAHRQALELIQKKIRYSEHGW